MTRDLISEYLLSSDFDKLENYDRAFLYSSNISIWTVYRQIIFLVSSRHCVRMIQRSNKKMFRKKRLTNFSVEVGSCRKE